MEKRDYSEFLQEVRRFVPQERIYTDELRRLAWGTDAGFYRLVPQLVIDAANEQEVIGLLKAASRHRLPVTFRAAGTSLSGQAISDSILLIAGKHWEEYSLSPDHRRITLQPGLTGQRVNELLQPYGRKFSPDPASVRSAMVGGIVMNNASGMNCGTHANSDQMLVSARMVLADGTVLDTGQQASRWLFARTHAPFLERIKNLRDIIRDNTPLADRIRYKYSIKNVTGLNLRPFIAFDDPFEIIAHLLVGSEGTLAFLSEVTLRTEYDYPCRASAMLYFSDIREACRAVVAMKSLVDPNTGERLVFGAELLDAKSLASVGDSTGNGLTAVLTETKAHTPEELNRHIASIGTLLASFDTYTPVHFTGREEEYSKYWAIRSGIFPSVGGTRPLGTTCLIEDVAFHLDDLPEATADLQELIARHGYHDACIYGHALEGNYHFILNQSFGTDAETKRYQALMDEVKELVVGQYDGSLKAEHGTGRNMAPFVRYEWGDKIFHLMLMVKGLFDPHWLLNPGVIFNDDSLCHLRDFKPLPLLQTTVASSIDRCIECGFCEVSCLTCGLTLSPRQRIVVQREISRLRQSEEDPQLLALLEKQYRYLGNATCAGDGLCAMSCPMNINTGDLTHALRQASLPPGSLGYRVGDFAANHFAGMKQSLRPLLTLANAAHTVLGTPAMSALTRTMHRALGMPLWVPAMPKPLPPTPSPVGRGGRGERLSSLDVLRGITIAGMILVNNPGSWSTTYAPLQHAAWEGLTPTDLVFPFFMFIMGISTYISLQKYQFVFSPSAALKILRRTVVIFAIGLFIALFAMLCRTGTVDLAHLRILGVMQRLALCYGATALIALTVKHRYIPYLIAAILLFYFLLLVTGNGFENSDTSILAIVDRAVLGEAHLYRGNIDPEGLLSTLPAIAHVLIGFCVGGLLMTVKDIDKKLERLFLVGTILTFAGFLLSYGCPINKKIWSPTFVLVTCGLASSFLALLVWIIDVKGYKGWSRFFEAFGVNPLFIYVMAGILSILLGSITVPYGGGESISLHGVVYNHLLQPLLGDYPGSLAYALLFITLNWGIGYILYKKKIYIKI